MSNIKTWLADTLAMIPLPILAFFSIFMLIAPISPEPHLAQKFNWLMTGQPFKAIDIFDVFWHLLPSILLVLKLVLKPSGKSS